ncbi:hypothetical protein FQZ97_501410 [compost metagenome]
MGTAGQARGRGRRLRLELRLLERGRLLRQRRRDQTAAAPVVAGHRRAVLHLLARAAGPGLEAQVAHARGARHGGGDVVPAQRDDHPQPPHGRVLFAAVALLGADDRRHAGLRAAAPPAAAARLEPPRAVDRRPRADRAGPVLHPRRQGLPRVLGHPAVGGRLLLHRGGADWRAQPLRACVQADGLGRTDQLPALPLALAAAGLRAHPGRQAAFRRHRRADAGGVVRAGVADLPVRRALHAPQREPDGDGGAGGRDDRLRRARPAGDHALLRGPPQRSVLQQDRRRRQGLGLPGRPEPDQGRRRSAAADRPGQATGAVLRRQPHRAVRAARGRTEQDRAQHTRFAVIHDLGRLPADSQRGRRAEQPLRRTPRRRHAAGHERPVRRRRLRWLLELLFLRDRQAQRRERSGRPLLLLRRQGQAALHGRRRRGLLAQHARDRADHLGQAQAGLPAAGQPGRRGLWP